MLISDTIEMRSHTRKSSRKRSRTNTNNGLFLANVQHYTINGPVSAERAKTIRRSVGQRNVFQMNHPLTVRPIESVERNQVQSNRSSLKRYSLRNGAQIPASLRTLRNTLVTMPSARHNNLINAYFHHK